MPEKTDVVLRTRAEVLYGYHNAHMQMMIAAALNFVRLVNVDDKEIVNREAVKVPGSPTPIIREVTAKQQRALEQGTLKENGALLVVIEEMLAKEGKPVSEEVKASVMLDAVLALVKK